MDYDFCFPRTFSLIRRSSGGTIENFSVKGIAKIDFSVKIDEHNRRINKGIFLFSPDFEILPGDIISDGTENFQLHKIEHICDFDNKIKAYRGITYST